MTDETAATIQRLLEANPIREPVLRAVIRTLQLPEGSRGLDVGCGLGLQALLLAEAVGAAGHVTGVDIAPELLAYGESLAARAGLADRVTFQVGDAGRLPFGAGTFDWVWSADCVGYPTCEAAALAELARAVRPGGGVILLAWTAQQVLPGYPLLEARLNAHYSSYGPYLEDKRPDQHFLRAASWFEAIGLRDVQARSFVGEVQAPLSVGERAALASLFGMLWAAPDSGDADEDWRMAQRLCPPGSPDFILDAPGYYASFTYTLFRGTAPGG